MSQTDLNSDNFCGMNQAAAPLQWILQKAPEQGFNNTFAFGSVGINARSNYIRPDTVNIESFLSGRDDILTKCNPPIPALDEANEAPLTYQNSHNTNSLQPIYTREKRSSVNLAAVSHIPLTFQTNLPNPPQDVDHIIFQGSAQRGGANTSNIVKNAWNSENFKTFLGPQRACGDYCSEANGYRTRLQFSKQNPEAKWGDLPKGLPGKNWFNPMITGTSTMDAKPDLITSQLATAVGASGDGSGPQYLSSGEPLPVIDNPYDRHPKSRNPTSGHYYYGSPMDNIVSR